MYNSRFNQLPPAAKRSRFPPRFCIGQIQTEWSKKMSCRNILRLIRLPASAVWNETYYQVMAVFTQTYPLLCWLPALITADALVWPVPFNHGPNASLLWIPVIPLYAEQTVRSEKRPQTGAQGYFVFYWYLTAKNSCSASKISKWLLAKLLT